MAEPWEAPAQATERWEHTVLHAIRALGVLKQAETPQISHAYGCPLPRNPAAACSCPGGPEIQWPDYDEVESRRHYVFPDRFVRR